MFERLLSWFEEGGAAGFEQDELQMAVAALLIETARIDRAALDERERQLIGRLLQERFGLGPEAARDLEQAAERRAERSAQLFGFVRTINEQLGHEQRVRLIEMLWQVAYADGVLDPLEDSLLRRIGGLIDVSDHERGEARRRVMRQRGLAEQDNGRGIRP